MDREESQIHYASKRERLVAVTIFMLMLLSFFLHLCALSGVLLKNIDEQNNQTDANSKDHSFLFHLNDLFGLFRNQHGKSNYDKR